MRRYILTGTPGAGKTSILLELKRRGHPVVPEAATDVIAQATQNVERHWEQPSFIEQILAVQCERQALPATLGRGVQFFDRSPICTLALAEYLGHPTPATLVAEIERLGGERFYEREVFFIRDLGFVVRTKRPENHLRTVAGIRGRARRDLRIAGLQTHRHPGRDGCRPRRPHRGRGPLLGLKSIQPRPVQSS